MTELLNSVRKKYFHHDAGPTMHKGQLYQQYKKRKDKMLRKNKTDFSCAKATQTPEQLTSIFVKAFNLNPDC